MDWSLPSYATINWISVLLLSAASLRWGAEPERWGAGVFVGMLVVDRLYHLAIGRGGKYWTLDAGHLAIDTLAAAAFVALALTANRKYTLWLAALQVISVLAHFARVMNAGIAAKAYGYLGNAPSYLGMMILMVGIVLHARHLRRTGSYPSWLRSSNHTQVTKPLQ
jgi:hypothetical protein